MLGQHKLAKVYEILPDRKVGRPPADEVDRLKVGFWGPRYERDVEILFVESLLYSLSYGEGTCWQRPNYKVISGEETVEIIPDYSFGDYNHPAMVLETKYRIHTTSEFFQAHKQVSNYGGLLGCKVVCTASLDGLWIFPKVDGSFEELIHMDWVSVRTESGFQEVSKVIGLEAIVGPIK